MHRVEGYFYVFTITSSFYMIIRTFITPISINDHGIPYLDVIVVWFKLSFWLACDGANGAADIRGRFILGTGKLNIQ